MTKKTIDALLAFNKAFYTFLENWGNLNETESISFYPFTESFDEIKIHEWIEATVKEFNYPHLKN